MNECMLHPSSAYLFWVNACWPVCSRSESFWNATTVFPMNVILCSDAPLVCCRVSGGAHLVFLFPRDSLERTRLKFSLQGGKVTALCRQEGEQVWALNIKRALLSMLQTSRMASKQELEKEVRVDEGCVLSYNCQVRKLTASALSSWRFQNKTSATTSSQLTIQPLLLPQTITVIKILS